MTQPFKIERVSKGYVCYTGYRMSKADADLYNKTCNCPLATPEQQHLVFTMIALTNKKDQNND